MLPWFFFNTTNNTLFAQDKDYSASFFLLLFTDKHENCPSSRLRLKGLLLERQFSSPGRAGTPCVKAESLLESDRWPFAACQPSLSLSPFPTVIKTEKPKKELKKRKGVLLTITHRHFLFFLIKDY